MENEKVAQFCLRGNVAHIQYGTPEGYEKFDTTATPAVVAAFNASKVAGTTRDSLAVTSTQYAPLEVRSGKRSFVFVPPPVFVGEVVIYSE